MSYKLLMPATSEMGGPIPVTEDDLNALANKGWRLLTAFPSFYQGPWIYLGYVFDDGRASSGIFREAIGFLQPLFGEDLARIKKQEVLNTLHHLWIKENRMSSNDYVPRSQFESLQRQVRCMFTVGITLIVLLAVVMLTGFGSPPVQDTVISKNFTLVDSSGKTVATLTNNGGTTSFNITPSDGSTQVFLSASQTPPGFTYGQATVLVGRSSGAWRYGGNVFLQSQAGKGQSGGASADIIDLTSDNPPKGRLVHLGADLGGPNPASGPSTGAVTSACGNIYAAAGHANCQNTIQQ